MKRLLISVAALGLVAIQGSAVAGDPAEMAAVCTDCHEFSDFEGMSAAEISEGFSASVESSKKKAKAVGDISAEDLAAIAEFVAAEANK